MDLARVVPRVENLKSDADSFKLLTATASAHSSRVLLFYRRTLSLTRN